MITAEILAPAGNIESLKAAVQHGADAVYFGLSDFNARMKADNFTTDNLAKWVDFCHLYGTKVYLTLNTLIKNDEIEKLAYFIYKAATSNVDAFIVADIATVKLCQNICPDIPLHFSTQFGIHNLEGAISAVELGASRIILSRETPLSEIKRIRDGINVEIEAFVHGAMCVSFSGNCYLSSSIDCNSGNRGKCKQPCRLKYRSSITQKEGYYLSMKDLCLIGKISELYESGVVSFKIEGRLKSPEYVAAAVVAYRRALNGNLKTEDLDNLKSAYSRNYTETGYLYGDKYNIITSDIQNNVGLVIGKIEKTVAMRNGLFKIYFSSNRKLSKGDGLKVVWKNKEVCGAELTSQNTENGLYVLYTTKNPSIGATVSLTQNVNLLKSLSKKTIGVEISLVEIQKGKYVISISDGEVEANCEFCVEEIVAQNNQVDGIKKVLSKGIAPFVIESLNVKIDSDIFIPHSILNNSRKACLDLFYQKRIDKYKKGNINVLSEKLGSAKISKIYDSKRKAVFLIDERTIISKKMLEIADAVIISTTDYSVDVEGIINKLYKKVKIYLALPVIAFEKDIEVLCKTIEKYNTQLDGVYVNNQYGVEIAKRYNLELFAGTGLNILNKMAREQYNDCVLSKELNIEEINELDDGAYIYVYGFEELMYFAHCPNFAAGGNCSKCEFDKNEQIQYSQQNAKYNIARVKIKDCYFTLRSNKATCLFVFAKKYNKNVLIDLTMLSDTDEVIDAYLNGINLPNTVQGRLNRGRI